MSGKSYPSRGRCIFCGNPDGPRTREHIVAKAIGGDIVIQDATCESCQRVLDQFEREIHRTYLVGPRRKLGLVGHTRLAKQKKKLPLRHVTRTGIVTTMVAREDYPAIIGFPKFTPPFWSQSLTGPSSEPVVTNMVLRQLDFRPEVLAKKYGVTRPEGMLLHLPPFGRYLAKIAHCCAVAMLGIDGFVPVLRNAIIDPNMESREALMFVGGMAGSAPASSDHIFQLHIAGQANSRFYFAEIQLFSAFDMPSYAVLIGAEPGSTLPQWPLPPEGPMRALRLDYTPNP